MPTPTEAFEKIVAFYEERKRMPSYRELARLLSLKSIKRTVALIETLIAAGAIGRDPSGRLLPTRSFHEVKVLGTVEAGFPSPAEEELLDTMTLDEWLIRHREATYMLQVRGESMINAGIRPGDVALVERGKEPRDGDIVIACVDGKWTMKYYHKHGRGAILVPANPKFKTIYPKEELRVEAVVTAVIRKMK
jgi:repressor LexA